MRWENSKSDGFESIICTNPYKDKYLLNLTPNNKNLIKEENNDCDIRYLSKKVNHYPTVDDIKNILLDLQVQYDNSEEVNSFYIDNKKVWFDKATRVGLVNAINLQKELGNDIYKVWFNNIAIELEINRALKLLAMIENYASNCYNVTQRHITEIKQLDTIESCLKYDITANYPDTLNITLTD